MEERGMIDFLKERLSDNYVSTNVENMNIPVAEAQNGTQHLLCPCLSGMSISQASSRHNSWAICSNSVAFIYAINARKSKYQVKNREFLLEKL